MLQIDQVFKIMKSSSNKNEWNVNCKIVMKEFDGRRPYYWRDKIMKSGFYTAVRAKWSEV